MFGFLLYIPLKYEVKMSKRFDVASRYAQVEKRSRIYVRAIGMNPHKLTAFLLSTATHSSTGRGNIKSYFIVAKKT